MSLCTPPWIVAMDWNAVTFFHWPIQAEALRPLVPRCLAVDTFNGCAWIGIVAFRIEGTRLRGLPSSAQWRTFGEINVRTYVSAGKHSGAWFLSLDAAHEKAVRFGQSFLRLPYRLARVDARFDKTEASYLSVREESSATPTMFDASSFSYGDTFIAQQGSIEEWFAERYAFYTLGSRKKLLRGEVLHQPWPLRKAHATIRGNTLSEAAGLLLSSEPAFVHSSAGVRVKALPLQKTPEPS